MATDVIDNDYGDSDATSVSKIPPNSPLDFGSLIKVAIDLTPQSSTPSEPNEGWVYLDDGTNTDSGNKGLRYYNGGEWEDLLGYTQEEIEDIVNTLLEAGDKLSWTYDNDAGTLTIDTDSLDAEEVEDQVNSLLTTGSDITLNYDDNNNELTIGVGSDVLRNIVEDSSPSLGDDLDVNQKSIGDGDNDTRVEFEETDDEDIIRFYVDGTEALNID